MLHISIFIIDANVFLEDEFYPPFPIRLQSAGFVPERSKTSRFEKGLERFLE